MINEINKIDGMLVRATFPRARCPATGQDFALPIEVDWTGTVGQKAVVTTPMGFNKRNMEDERRKAAEKEVAARRATEKQILEDAKRLIAAWNERQAVRWRAKI
jgi:hypothetical protein